jgi:hypothetical protein
MLHFAKILFISAPGRAAILITSSAGRRRQQPMRFKDAHAALDWCIERGIVMIYTPTEPTGN